MTETRLYYNARVYPMRGLEPPKAGPDQALAVADGRILAVGREAEVVAAAGPDAVRVDLGGRTLVPGFIDAHHHMLQGALHTLGVPLHDCRSHEELLRRLSDAAKQIPAGRFVVGHNYDPRLLAEARAPHRRDLDDACPEHPVLVVEYSHHEGAANSRALAAAHLNRDSADPPAGRLGRDVDGALDGLLVETALMPVHRLAQVDSMTGAGDLLIDRLAGHERSLLGVGIVAVGDPAVDPAGEALYRTAFDEGRLRMTVVALPVSAEGPFAPPGARLKGPPTGEGGDRLRIGPMKLFLDGAHKCAMCFDYAQVAEMIQMALQRSVQARSGEPLRRIAERIHFHDDMRVHWGIRYYEREPLCRLADRITDHGFGVAMHAIGNEAVEYAIDALSRVRHPDVTPPRIEHGTVMTAELARRCGNTGIAVVAQPDFLRLPAFEHAAPFGGLLHKGLRTLLDSGVLLAGSSDAPVSGYDPLDGLRSAVTRRTRRGRLLQPEQAITPYEALHMYTRAAAQVSGIADSIGSLEPGKRADLVVLSHDPCEPGVDLDSLVVDETMLSGETVYARHASQTRLAS